MHLSGVPSGALGPGAGLSLLREGQRVPQAFGVNARVSPAERLSPKTRERVSEITLLGLKPAVVRGQAGREATHGSSPSSPGWPESQRAGGVKHTRGLVPQRREAGRLGEATAGPRREPRLAGEGTLPEGKRCRLLDAFLSLDKVPSPAPCPGLREAGILHQPRLSVPIREDHLSTQPTQDPSRGAHCLWATPREWRAGGPSPAPTPPERPGQPGPWGWGQR